MITRFADILRNLQAREAEMLSKQVVVHALTIGEMYEGLTRELLDLAIPDAIGLQIVDGFVVGPDGGLSPQIDCMLVKGNGTPVPYTSHHQWPVKDVIAVFEIKKKLYVAERSDSHETLRAVLEAYSKWVTSVADSKEAPDVRPAFQAFAVLTGLYPRDYKEVKKYPEALQHIFHTLVMEHLSPVRVVFGYDGFVDENGLRNGFVKFLDKHGQGKQGFGIGSLPTLIICGGNSIVKLNGYPYITRWTDDGWWRALASNAENPLRLLLELIWTRISHAVDIQMPPDDTLQDEILHPLLSARIGRVGDKLGWEYSQTVLSKEQLKDQPQIPEWEPTKIDDTEWTFLNVLSIQGYIELNDTSFLKFASDNKLDATSMINGLVEKRIIAQTNTSVRLISLTLTTCFTPDGQAWAATDPNRLSLWANQWKDRQRT